MLTTMKASQKRISKRNVMEDKGESTLSKGSRGDECEINGKTSEGKKPIVDKRRRSGGGSIHRRMGITKAFSSMRFLPLDNDVEGNQEELEKLPQTPVKDLGAESSTASVNNTPSTVATLLTNSKSTIFSNSEFGVDHSPAQRRSSLVDKKHRGDAPPPLPPRRSRSSSFTTHQVRRTSFGSAASRQSHQSAQRSHASAVANAVKLEALEDEMDSLTEELNDVEMAQQNLQQQRLDEETRQEQLQEEFEYLQRDVMQKLAEIENYESDNDRLQEECLHFETQVFSMTKSLEACLSERDAKNAEYQLAHDEWDKIHQLGSELLHALYDHHMSASSPDHVDLELRFRRQKEMLDEMQEEVLQLKEEVKAYQVEPKTTTCAGPTIFIIPDPPQSRLPGSSPKRTYSLIPHAANSPSNSKSSSGSSQSRSDVDATCNTKGTNKDTRKLAAQELRHVLQQRRSRRSSLATESSR